MNDFNNHSVNIINYCFKFQVFLQNYSHTNGGINLTNSLSKETNENNVKNTETNEIVKSIYFIMVKDVEETPTIQLCNDDNQTTHKIFILRTNSGFIDAGETFMGNYLEEVKIIKNSILRFASL